jgi:glycosyltransferase involved in cell wall biosynthesis
MRILYLTPRPCWPLLSGGRLRDYHLARTLAARADLVYLGLSDPGSPFTDEAVPGLPRYVLAPKDGSYSAAKILAGIAGSTPLPLLNCDSRAAESFLRKLFTSQTFDSVQIEGVHMRRYLPLLKGLAPGIPVLCDWHDIHSEQMSRFSQSGVSMPKRWYAARTARKLAGHEDLLLAECPLHAACSQVDREKLLRRHSEAKIHIVENGVDVPFYDSPREPSAGSSSIVFVGNMSYHANTDAVTYFAQSIWPLIRRDAPELRFTIVGSNPTSEVRQLAQLPGIEVTGTVDDVRTYYRQAAAVAVPLRAGTGTRLKILEAMAAGVPVVSTAIGAEGLEAPDGNVILIADSPERFAASILSLARDPVRRDRMAAAARVWVERFDWSHIGARLYALHQSLASKPR